jgi:hypothetical protein
MNFYVVTEGAVEARVYRKWIPLIDPTLTFVRTPAELLQNNFTIISGGGYPFFMGVIKNAIAQIQTAPLNARLVICVDSEEATYQQKYHEIAAHVAAHQTGPLDSKIVVQHFCFEAWALGNMRLPRKVTRNAELLEYRAHYDVLALDPEGLTPIYDLNRAQFTEVYLRRIVNDRNSRLSYSKHNPAVVEDPTYFHELKRRLTDTGHIDSFQHFEVAFS